jgi:hypothetical protein
MESKKGDPLKARFLAVRKEIHNRYTDKWKTAVSIVKDADGKMVGPAFKTMKSEFVAWKRQSVRKSMICMMKTSMTNPKEPSRSAI